MTKRDLINNRKTWYLTTEEGVQALIENIWDSALISGPLLDLINDVQPSGSANEIKKRLTSLANNLATADVDHVWFQVKNAKNSPIPWGKNL